MKSVRREVVGCLWGELVRNGTRVVTTFEVIARAGAVADVEAGGYVCGGASGGSGLGSSEVRPRGAARMGKMFGIVSGAGSWIKTTFDMVVRTWLARDGDGVGVGSGNVGALRAMFATTS